MLLLLISLLIKENKFSNAGYQSMFTTKKGEIKLLFKFILISKYPVKKATKYEPLSPRYTLPKMLKIKKIIKDVAKIFIKPPEWTNSN